MEAVTALHTAHKYSHERGHGASVWDATVQASTEVVKGIGGFTVAPIANAGKELCFSNDGNWQTRIKRGFIKGYPSGDKLWRETVEGEQAIEAQEQARETELKRQEQVGEITRSPKKQTMVDWALNRHPEQIVMNV